MRVLPANQGLDTAQHITVEQYLGLKMQEQGAPPDCLSEVSVERLHFLRSIAHLL